MTEDEEYELQSLGASVLIQLANNPSFAEFVAREEIERQIAEGILIPAERLQVSDQLRLVDATRYAELEKLAGATLDEAKEDEQPEEEEAVEEVVEAEPDPKASKRGNKLDPADAPFACSSCGKDVVGFEEAQVAIIKRQPIICADCAEKDS